MYHDGTEEVLNAAAGGRRAAPAARLVLVVTGQAFW